MNNIKPSYEEKRTVLGEVLPLKTPYTLIIDVGDLCNLHCNYCFRAVDSTIEAKDYRKNQLMTWETFKRIVEQMKEFPNEFKRISFSNHGEPMCNPKLPDMIKYLKEQGIIGKCDIHTNGVLLSHSMSDRLIDSGIDRIVVSVQGMTAGKYMDVAKVKINFDEFYDNLKYFYQNKTNTQLDIKIVDAALDEGEDELFYEKFDPIADKVFIEKVVPIWTGTTEHADGNNKYGEIIKWQQSCPLSFYTMCVLASGKIYPCTNLIPPYEPGDIYTTTLKQAWDGDKRREFLLHQLENGRDCIEACKDCYIPQNTVFRPEDSIDEYREDIIKRMKNKSI